MKLMRKNVNNSYFLLQKEDKENFEKGVYLVTHKGEEKPIYKMICSVIYLNSRIESKNYHTDLTKIIYDLVIVDRENEQRYIVEAKNLFDGSYADNDFFKTILNSGFVLWESKRLLLEYLKLQDEKTPIRKGVENMGWSDDDYYISGFSTSNEIVFTGSDRNSFKKGGTREGQYSYLKNILTEYPLVFFIYSYCQAGFFNRFLNEDHNQILEVIGESSKGKSTVGRLCMSAYTNPSSFASFNMTKNSIGETMKFYNDNFIYFDETGEAKVKDDERHDLIYGLANGITKSRTKKISKDSNDFTTETQRRMFYSLLIGGEESILKNLKKTGGIEARLCQIVLDNSTHLFENVDSEFIEGFNLEISKNFGWVAPELITQIKLTKEGLQEQYTKNLQYVRDKYQINSVIENRKVKILAYTYLSATYIANVIFGEEEDELSSLLIENMLDKAYEAIFKNVSYNSESDDPYKTALSSITLTHTKHFKITDFIGNSLNNTENLKDYYGDIITGSLLEVRILSSKIEDFCSSVFLDKDRLLTYIEERGFLFNDKEKGRSRRTKKIKGVNYYVFKIPLRFFDDIQSVEPPVDISKLEEIETPFVTPEL